LDPDIVAALDDALDLDKPENILDDDFILKVLDKSVSVLSTVVGVPNGLSTSLAILRSLAFFFVILWPFVLVYKCTIIITVCICFIYHSPSIPFWKDCSTFTS